MIDEKLVKILQCPATGQPLRLATPEEKSSLKRGADETVLITEDCRRAYFAQDGIPILLADAGQAIG